MEKLKVSEDVALKEVHKWLDDMQKDDRDEDQINVLVKSICAGFLTLNKDFELVQKLKFPIKAEDGSIVEKELKYINRLTLGDIQERTVNVKATDTYGMVNAYISALTGLNSGIVKKINSQDGKISQSIATFFL